MNRPRRHNFRHRRWLFGRKSASIASLAKFLWEKIHVHRQRSEGSSDRRDQFLWQRMSWNFRLGLCSQPIEAVLSKAVLNFLHFLQPNDFFSKGGLQPKKQGMQFRSFEGARFPTRVICQLWIQFFQALPNLPNLLADLLSVSFPKDGAWVSTHNYRFGLTKLDW